MFWLLLPQFGPFTPLLKLTRLVIGDKPLNKLRGKGIALHSQVRSVAVSELFFGCTPCTLFLLLTLVHVLHVPVGRIRVCRGT